MSGDYVLAIDQGTTGTTVILFDHQSNIVGKVYQEFTQYYPRPGWVEHDAAEIQRNGAASGWDFPQAAVDPSRVTAIGVTNQRKQWSSGIADGEPVTRAIVWQCRRTAGLCDDLRRQGLEPLFRKTAWFWTPTFRDQTEVDF